jgi:hypothetical protein
MEPSLVVCSRCRRHVKNEDRACPFCRARMPRRAALGAFVAGLSLAAVACSGAGGLAPAYGPPAPEPPPQRVGPTPAPLPPDMPAPAYGPPPAPPTATPAPPQMVPLYGPPPPHRP